MEHLSARACCHAGRANTRPVQTGDDAAASSMRDRGPFCCYVDPREARSSDFPGPILHCASPPSRVPTGLPTRHASVPPPRATRNPTPRRVILYPTALASGPTCTCTRPHKLKSLRKGAGEARHPINTCIPHSMRKRSDEDAKLTPRSCSMCSQVARPRRRDQPGLDQE